MPSGPTGMARTSASGNASATSTRIGAAMVSDRVSTVAGERFTQLSTELYFLLTMPIHTAGMTSLRPIRFRRSRTAKTVEALTDLLGALTLERQTLRECEAGSDQLEQNRIAIARAQWELSHALIARYLPVEPAAQTAA